MIANIIESLDAGIECMSLFEKIYPLVEQKESDGKTILAYNKGKGQYEHVTNFDNHNGICYFRQISDVEISKTENPNKACADLLLVKYVLRCVCCIKRDQLPIDCCSSDDEFAWIIAKELTGRGGSLKSALGAQKVYILATKISTDRKKILADELPSDKIIDINYNYSLVAIDFSIDIDIQKSCISLLCDSYYSTTTFECTPRVYCSRNDRVVEVPVEDNVYSYDMPEIKNAEVLFVQYADKSIFRDQWTKPFGSSVFTITDPLVWVSSSQVPTTPIFLILA